MFCHLGNHIDRRIKAYSRSTADRCLGDVFCAEGELDVYQIDDTRLRADWLLSVRHDSLHIDFDPGSGAVFVGNLVTLPAAFLDTACGECWKSALKRVERVPFPNSCARLRATALAGAVPHVLAGLRYTAFLLNVHTNSDGVRQEPGRPGRRHRRHERGREEVATTNDYVLRHTGASGARRK
jgi:hypothetical protein